MDAAVNIAAVGLDPLQFLNAKDDITRNIMVKIQDELVKLQHIKDHNLAVAIASQIGKLFK